MKVSILAMLSVAAMAAPQLSGSARNNPVMKSESVKQLEPKLRAGAKRTFTRWGPYTLAGHNVRSPSVAATIPTAGRCSSTNADQRGKKEDVNTD